MSQYIMSSLRHDALNTTEFRVAFSTYVNNPAYIEKYKIGHNMTNLHLVHLQIMHDVANSFYGSGYLSLWLTYGSFISANLLAPGVIQLSGHKPTMVIYIQTLRTNLINYNIIKMPTINWLKIIVQHKQLNLSGREI